MCGNGHILRHCLPLQTGVVSNQKQTMNTVLRYLVPMRLRGMMLFVTSSTALFAKQTVLIYREFENKRIR